MRSKVLSIVFVLAIVMTLSLIMILFTDSKPTENNQYTYTKAICNETNYCQDYEITCQNNQVLRMNPITGASVQFSQDWQDPRDENSNAVCE
jgi:hypothetical protein